MRNRWTVPLAALALVACTAPGDPTAPGGTAQVTTTTVQTTAPQTTTALTTTVQPTTESPDALPAMCTVPEVVGMVHQDAQDSLQAAGFYNLREEDATGQGRLLVVDRNWVTTAQSVPAGQRLDCTSEIRLAAKKKGE